MNILSESQPIGLGTLGRKPTQRILAEEAMRLVSEEGITQSEASKRVGISEAQFYAYKRRILEERGVGKKAKQPPIVKLKRTYTRRKDKNQTIDVEAVRKFSPMLLAKESVTNGEIPRELIERYKEEIKKSALAQAQKELLEEE